MDDAPLTKAHDHAKAASLATHQSDSTVAINEHALAAGEFANAAKSTTSTEALRTLRLLEEHHLRLSELLKLPLDTYLPPTDADTEQKQPGEGAGGAGDASNKSEQPTLGKSGAVPTPGLAKQKRYPSGRISTSSIASNLASARGIRSRDHGKPVPPSVSNDQAPGNVESAPRQDGVRSKMHTVLETGKPAWVPPTATPARQEGQRRKKAPEVAPQPDDGYTRFYNTFGNIINRLSAPLAFAGLPLITEESITEEQAEAAVETSPTKRHRHKSPAAPPETDLSKIYSRATMRALSGQNASESFYVVPTSGHTMSYANIINYADKEKRRLEASFHISSDASNLEEEDDDFVDARETLPHSPVSKRRSGRSGGTARGNVKTAEELALENKSLKDMLDKLSRRLHAFEASAQNSGLALAESMRFKRPGSPGGGGGGGVVGTSAAGGDDPSSLRVKNRELEEQVTFAMQRMELLEKENDKAQRALVKYREKWDLLKAGAKARREAQGNGGGGEVASVEEEGS